MLDPLPFAFLFALQLGSSVVHGGRKANTTPETHPRDWRYNHEVVPIIEASMDGLCRALEMGTVGFGGDFPIFLMGLDRKTGLPLTDLKTFPGELEEAPLEVDEFLSELLVKIECENRS